MDFASASKEDALKAVKKFVEDYNSVIDTADDVNSKSVLRNAAWMTNIVGKSSGLLNELGITVGKDNKLTVNEEKWNNASATTKASLFNGKNSLSDKILYKAGQLVTTSAAKNGKAASSYTAKGDYSNTTEPTTIDKLF